MKVPEPRKLKSGRYFIQLRLGGVSIPVTADTARDCRRQAELIKAEYRNGKAEIRRELPRPATLSTILGDYITDYEPVLSPSTIRGYEQIQKHRFSDYMELPPEKIKWQEMINRELETVGEKTVKNAWGLVCSALRHAKYPVPEVRLPQIPVKEIPFLQPEEILPFCAAIRGDIAEIAVLLELQGLRRSEAKGLEWGSVDLEARSIQVRGARVQNRKGEFVRKETNKNLSSVRTVPIMIPQLSAALAAVENKSGPVVLVSENTMLRHAKNACKAAGVTVVGNHGLRHSYASTKSVLIRQICFYNLTEI